jgi:hypothetical protein
MVSAVLKKLVKTRRLTSNIDNAFFITFSQTVSRRKSFIKVFVQFLYKRNKNLRFSFFKGFFSILQNYVQPENEEIPTEIDSMGT